MASKRVKYILLSLSAVAVVVCGVALWLYLSLTADAVSREADLKLPEGTTIEILQDSLRAGGYIANDGHFALACRLLRIDRVRPGNYELRSGTSYIQLARVFSRGLQTPVSVTFNNIRVLPQLAGRLSDQLQPDSSSFARVLDDDSSAAKYGFNRETFIAMFVPNTYQMYWTTTPEGFLDRMHREYEAFWQGSRDEKLQTLGLSRTEAVTLASVVYEETKMSDEMPTVAGVYLNRLARGMKLQADPTVKFAVGDFTLRRILYRHLEVESPYNTYLHAGIPPGPICMPSVAAIDAVLNPARHSYLYFCARADFSGYHKFAITHAEHNRNRDEWRRALDRAGIR